MWCLAIGVAVLLLRQLRCVLPVDMRHARVQSAKTFVHHTYFRSQLIVLLLILACVLCLGTDLAQPVAHVVLTCLYIFDVLDSCHERISELDRYGKRMTKKD